MRTPPFLISFEDKNDYFQALLPDTLDAYKISLDSLINKRLPPIVSIRCLAVLFGLSPKFIGSLLTKTDNYYRIFTIKKGKKNRIIEAPQVGLKVIQKWIATHLSENVTLHESVHGFVPKKSYVSAAKVHLQSKWVYSIDIENFFQSTSIEKVKNAFIKLGYPEHGAMIASKLCCYKGHLAQGSPASPVLSNIIFKSLDDKISILANELSVQYTRYADDLVFSGKGEFPENLYTVKSIIEENQWKIATHKEHLSKSPNRLKVHGLLVHRNHVRLTKGYRNKIRAYTHLYQNGKITEKDRSRICGHLTLAKFINKQSVET
jgi:RNA-directed DNA polymerase